MRTRQPITDSLAKTISIPAGASKVIVYDAPAKLRDLAFVPGFGLRLTEAGSKTFILRYRADGRDRTMRIGTYGTWSVAAARERARELRRAVESGGDPQRERAEEAAASTLSDAWDKFKREYSSKLRPRSIEAYAGAMNSHALPALGKHKVARIEHSDIVQLHNKVTVDAGPYAANRVVATLSRLFNVCIKWKLIATNPAKGVERNQEVKRKRYLTADELAALLAAIAKLRHRQSGDAIRLLILTGARKGETLAAQWSEFDLQAGIWTKPGSATKQKTEHRVPLSAAAQALVADMFQRRTSDVWLFPAGEEGHQTELKSAWASIVKNAKLSGIRVHDIRHSYASFLASSGVSLLTIGGLLGHSSPVTTARYAHLIDAALKEATEKVGAMIDGKSKGTPADVIPIKSKRKARR